MATSSDLHTHGPSRLSRRTAIEGMLAGSMLALALGPHMGLAEGTPEAITSTDRMHPNSYSLSGKGTRISYATSSFAGVPTFSYTGPDAEVSAEGDGIGVEPVVTGGWPFGSLVSVYVDAAPDAWARSLTLVLPEINLVEGGNETAFTTFAVLTTHFTNIGGPKFVEGQFQEYEIIALDGTASAVLF